MDHIDLPGAILVLGFVFWLAGGSKWLAEKTRKLKIENDLKEEQQRKD
jgi:hypothetical protein